MLEIIYRIYEYLSDEDYEKELAESSSYNFVSRKKQIKLDCLICDSREQFKEIIQKQYDKDISFKFSKSVKLGDLYCVIIGEHCYNTEKYCSKVEFTCTNCESKVTLFASNGVKLSDYEKREYLYGSNEYDNTTFCCERCKTTWLHKMQHELIPSDDYEFYIDKFAFDEHPNGYIYKITKKSTKEFYIGQSQYVPVFRWAQHLKGNRFPVSDITDYEFEVLHIVSSTENRLQVEKYYIQEYYKNDPEHSLNIACTSNIDYRKKII